MENASKALLIAGAVLLAMIVISAIMIVQGEMGEEIKRQDESLEAKQLAEFNMKYKSYEKDVRGIDLRSLMNTADDDNSKDSRQITIEFIVNKDLDGKNQAGKVGDIVANLVDWAGTKPYNNMDKKEDFKKEVLDNGTRLTNFNKRVFRHLNTNLDGTGRVSKMTFEEIY